MYHAAVFSERPDVEANVWPAASRGGLTQQCSARPGQTRCCSRVASVRELLHLQTARHRAADHPGSPCFGSAARHTTFGIPAASRMPSGEGRLSPSFPSPPTARFALIGDEVTPERFAQPDGCLGTLVAAGRSPRHADRHGARRDSSFQEQTRRRRWARVDEQLECSRRKRPERRPVPRRACVHPDAAETC